ncbi:MAG TPA: hypothetical protein PLY93_00615, partial [Turneriella sp.]|nr:hypothetical protein [Turneriella sp.]
HPYFEDEMNPHKGFGATMSRIIYTGGLRLKDFIFGKADLELIEVVLDKNLTPLELSWEGVENYQPKNFGVKHKNQTEKNAKPPYCFSVITWNHMVARTDASACMAAPRLTPQYFAEEAWQEFRMVKKTEAILRRNRAHRAYERKAASTR